MFLHNRVKQNWLAFQSLFGEKQSVNIFFFFFFKPTITVCSELYVN